MLAKPSEFDRSAVIAIQGGGVYGLGLLGQLSAVIDRHEIAPLAISGTSAGAIIATLFWSGLTPKEIRDRFITLAVSDPTRETNAPKKPTLTDLLGPFEPSHSPFTFERFREFATQVDSLVGANREIFADPASRGEMILRMVTHPIRAIRMAWILHRVVAVVRQHAQQRGLFAGKTMERQIDLWMRESPKLQAYRDRLAPHQWLTFGLIRDIQRDHPDNPNTYFPPLILTVTNITTRKLVLINSFDEAFKDVPIARAVRASAGFPFFFQPVEIHCDLGRGPETGWYVDGGVIANFPAWVFSSEFRRRMSTFQEFADLARRPWLNIGLRQVDDPTPTPLQPESPREFLESMFALLTGQVRNELERALTASVPRAISIEQPDGETSGPEHLLDVDKMTEVRIRAMFSRGEEFAEKQLAGLSFAIPQGNDRHAIEQILRDLVRRVLRIFGQSDNQILKFRGNIFLPAANRLALQYSYNMKPDGDRRLSLATGSGLTGFCYRDRTPWLCNLELLREAIVEEPDPMWFGMSRAEHQRVAEDRTWLASVPIFDPYDSGSRPDLPGRRKKPDPESRYFASWVERSLDGAVLGVLNLDAGLCYQNLGLSRDTERSLTDPRIRATVAVMRDSAREAGFLLARAFPSAPEHRNG